MKDEPVIDLQRAMPDYEFRADIFDERDERTRKVLRAMQHITDEERRLLVLFAECDSNYSKTARQLGVSPPTVANKIRAIRRRIIWNL